VERYRCSNVTDSRQKLSHEILHYSTCNFTVSMKESKFVTLWCSVPTDRIGSFCHVTVNRRVLIFEEQPDECRCAAQLTLSLPRRQNLLLHRSLSEARSQGAAAGNATKERRISPQLAPYESCHDIIGRC
jgi:hypothetical protein